MEFEYHRVSLHSQEPDYTDPVMPSHQNYPAQIALGNRGDMTYGDPGKANSVLNYFKGRRFTIDLKQSVENFLRDYAVCSRQQQLTPEPKRDYFVNCLEGSARIHFFNNRGDQLDYPQIVEHMRTAYNSDPRQSQAKHLVEFLRLKDVMEENDLHTDKLVDLIEELTPSCPPAFQSDHNKIDFLRRAALPFLLAKQPIKQIVFAR